MPVALFGTHEKTSSTSASAISLHRVDVWIFDLDHPRFELSRLSELLSPTEHARSSRFKRPDLAARWIVAHARLRQILGTYLANNAPYPGEFVLNAYGKPQVGRDSPVQPLHFNLSHSGRVCGVAVCLTAELGLDIETVSTPPWEIEPDVFNARERNEIASYAGFERQLAFYRGWTRKEAVIKAIGRGLSFSLQDLEVDLAQAQTRLRRLQNDHNPGWTIAGLEETGRWVGALAMNTAGAAIDVQLRDTSSHFGTRVGP